MYHHAINANCQTLAESRPLPERKVLMDALALVVSGDFDPALRAVLLQTPSGTDVWVEEENTDPTQVHQAREVLLNAIAVESLPQ